MEKRKYVRKDSKKSEAIKKDLNNAKQVLDTFVGLYGEDDGVNMFKPHLEYMLETIKNKLE